MLSRSSSSHPTGITSRNSFANSFLLLLLRLMVFVFAGSPLGCYVNPHSPLGESLASGSTPYSKLYGTIAYADYQGEGYYALEFIAQDTSKHYLVRNGQQGESYSELAWSFDGSKLIFYDSYFGKGSYHIVHFSSIIWPEDSVLNNGWNGLYPTFSPDGSITTVDTTHIWVNNEPFLTGHTYFPTRAAWSPDGSYLVVSIADSGESAGLYRVDAQTKAMVPLVQAVGQFNGTTFASPQVSPDGGMIAFTLVKKNGTPPLSVWVMNADGSAARWLTPDGVDDYNPAWAPDSKMIAFVRNYDLHAVNIDGTNIFRITWDKSSYDPAWTR